MQRAAQEMHLEAAQGDGASLRTHLERAYQATHKMDPLLAAASEPLPVPLQPLWGAYARLSHTRQAEGGLLPSEIESYGRLQCMRFSPREAEVLLGMDIAARVAGAERQRREVN